MANCTKCQHAKEIDRLRDICLGCAIGKDGCGLSNAGRCVVSLDAAKDENCRDLMLSRVAVDYVRRKAGADNLWNVPAAALPYVRAALYPFSALSDSAAALVCRMLRGERLVDIANAQGLTIQTVHARWKSLIRRNPVWKSLANGMIGSGRGRKSKRAQPRGKPQMRERAGGA